MYVNIFNIKRVNLLEKIKESLFSVLPIIVIVTFLCLTFVPLGTDLLLCFFIGSLMVIVGMGLFSLGTEMSMTPIGNEVGTAITKTKNLIFILLISFILGFAVTVAEPDLQVLASTVPHINDVTLLVAVGIGVGFFLSVCMLRIITGIKLKLLLIVFYGIVFALAFFTDRDFLSIAFDSGGVTTGPMTVPFILAMGIGVSNIRSDNKAESDSFGLVSLCSIGPVLAVLILGFFYSGTDAVAKVSNFSFIDTVQIGKAYIQSLPVYMKEISISLLPIVVIFLIFQIFSLKLSKVNLSKILFGLVYTYIGLVLFIVGVNVGFSSLGAVLGKEILSGPLKYISIPLCTIIGWFIISAEPAVSVLEKQIEEVSAGAISGKAVKLSLSVAISVAMALSAVRILTGIPILYFLLPGYIAAILMSFFVPDIYTAIAFDSGGVASGPMTSTFMLQFAIGASQAVGGNVLSDAFGIVALVALMPLISIQTLGLVSEFKTQKMQKEVYEYGDYDVVELWEEAV